MRISAAAVIAAALAVALLPYALSSYHLYQGAAVAFYLIAILGLNIVTGYTGQISLGHGAFMAIGGYTTAILVAHHHVGELWTIPLAGLVAGAVGLAFGLPALRLTGVYLSLATLGLAVAVPALVKKFDHFTGGSSGLLLPFHSNFWLYRLSWIWAGALFVVAWLVLRGRVGRAFRALRDSEVAAVSSGVNTGLYKLIAWGISAAYAGVAGSLFAIWSAGVFPGSFQFTLSLTLLIGAVVAGLGSLWGLVVGGLFVEFLPLEAQHVSKLAPGAIQGAILILVMFLLPSGFAGLLRRLRDLRRA